MADAAINLSPTVPVSLLVVPGTPALVIDLASVLRGPTGAKGDTGPAGTGADAGVCVAAVSMLAGTPAFVSRANGLLYPARADTYSSAFVLGLVSGDVLVGFAVRIVTAAVALADWTALTGAALLQPGQVYFLAATGGLTLQVPARPQCAASARVGVAVTATVLDVQPVAPLQL